MNKYTVVLTKISTYYVDGIQASSETEAMEIVQNELDSGKAIGAHEVESEDIELYDVADAFVSVENED